MPRTLFLLGCQEHKIRGMPGVTVVNGEV